MADRRVTTSGKNKNGSIMSLGGTWGIVPKSRAIREIKSRTHRYFVREAFPTVDVKVRGTTGQEYLTTEADGRSRNNLRNLPDCPSR